LYFTVKGAGTVSVDKLIAGKLAGKNNGGAATSTATNVL